MKNLRTKFERFCFRNRDKGIPNLMLYITIGSAIVYILSLINGGTFLYTWLCFDKSLILKGQIWRLVTYVFTYSPGSNPFLVLVFFYFSYHLARHVELTLGTLKFNLFYLGGMLLMDVFAMILCPTSTVILSNTPVPADFFTYVIYADMAFYLDLSILLLFASTHPDAQFLVFFIIPVKAWFMSIVYLVLIVIEIYNSVAFFPHNLFPLVGLANFLLFAGKDIKNLFPFAQNVRRAPPRQKSGTIPMRQEHSTPKKAAYTHRCTVCGKTDVSNPEMEFRYCSRCNGYFCYCQEHINNHTHVL